MTDIAPATDEQIARLEWWLSRAVQFLDGPREQKWFTLPDVNEDELSTLRGLIARIRADGEKIAAAESEGAAYRSRLATQGNEIARLKAELAKRDDALRVARQCIVHEYEDDLARTSLAVISAALGADHERK